MGNKLYCEVSLEIIRTMSWDDANGGINNSPNSPLTHWFPSEPETGNYTVIGLKQTGHEFSHSEGTLRSGLLQGKVWMALVAGMVALQDMFRRALSTPTNECAVPLTSWLFSRWRVERNLSGTGKCSLSSGCRQENIIPIRGENWSKGTEDFVMKGRWMNQTFHWVGGHTC